MKIYRRLAHLLIVTLSAPLSASTPEMREWCQHLLKTSARFREDHARWGDVLLTDPNRPLPEIHALGIPGNNGLEVLRNLTNCCIHPKTLADALGLSLSRVYKWTNPSNNSPVSPGYLFRVAEILGELNRSTPEEFLAKHPDLKKFSEEWHSSQKDRDLWRDKELIQEKSPSLLADHQLDNPAQLIDVLSFVEFRTPSAPLSLANSPEFQNSRKLRDTFMGEWTRNSNLPSNATTRQNLESQLLLQFGALTPGEQKKLSEAYHRRRARVPKFNVEKSLRENLEIEAQKRESEWESTHGYRLEPHDVLATFARLGFSSVLTVRYGVPNPHVYGMIRRDQPRMTGLMRIDLLNFAAKWPNINAQEMSEFFGIEVPEAERLLWGLRALELRDTEALKTFYVARGSPAGKARNTLRKEYDEADGYGFFRRRATEP
ncbi:MAG TPA: hypothetical protein VM901_09140 [Bdellovibrionota bacterium]|jgi:hypothetical protein|nr:hypothetical protein [Bdellovibrionota bacterium]